MADRNDREGRKAFWRAWWERQFEGAWVWVLGAVMIVGAIGYTLDGLGPTRQITATLIAVEPIRQGSGSAEIWSLQTEDGQTVATEPLIGATGETRSVLCADLRTGLLTGQRTVEGLAPGSCSD